MREVPGDDFSFAAFNFSHMSLDRSITLTDVILEQFDRTTRGTFFNALSRRNGNSAEMLLSPFHLRRRYREPMLAKHRGGTHSDQNRKTRIWAAVFRDRIFNEADGFIRRDQTAQHPTAATVGCQANNDSMFHAGGKVKDGRIKPPGWTAVSAPPGHRKPCRNGNR